MDNAQDDAQGGAQQALLAQVRYQEEDGSVGVIPLHPWNHAPRSMPRQDFEQMRRWWENHLREQHSEIVDSLLGEKLDVMQQCVAIEPAEDDHSPELRGIRNAEGLSELLSSMYAQCRDEKVTSTPPVVLLTAGPASGKTCLLSQVIIHSLDKGSGLIPIMIKVHQLQASLLEHEEEYRQAWNWIDAYVRLQLAADQKLEVPHDGSDASPLYRMLRQALMSRRVLILLDGLDEGGKKRDELEEHITEKLLPQGHVMVCTSRPAGIDEARFAAQLGTRWELIGTTPPSQGQELLDARLGAKLKEYEELPAATSLDEERDRETKRKAIQKLAMGAKRADGTPFEFDDFVRLEPVGARWVPSTRSQSQLARDGRQLTDPHLTAAFDKILEAKVGAYRRGVWAAAQQDKEAEEKPKRDRHDKLARQKKFEDEQLARGKTKLDGKHSKGKQRMTKEELTELQALEVELEAMAVVREKRRLLNQLYREKQSDEEQPPEKRKLTKEKLGELAKLEAELSSTAVELPADYVIVLKPKELQELPKGLTPAGGLLESDSLVTADGRKWTPAPSEYFRPKATFLRGGFRRLSLVPLSDEEQKQTIRHRLGGKADELIPYLTKVPVENGVRISSNPLMLSMIIAIFTLRDGLQEQMPTKMTKLYEVATDAMMSRAKKKRKGDVQQLQHDMLQAVFFQAHSIEQRVVVDQQLMEAALSLDESSRDELENIKSKAGLVSFDEITIPKFARTEIGHYVEVHYGGVRPWSKWQTPPDRGEVVDDVARGRKNGDDLTYRVRLTTGKLSRWLRPSEIRSSGLDRTRFLLQASDTQRLKKACAGMSPLMQSALEVMRTDVKDDGVPLMTMLSADPLRVQSSHLSFQEYFTARTLACSEGVTLSGSKPWTFSPFWANVVRLGTEMGEAFGEGLMRAAGVEDGVLDLRNHCIGGDRMTALCATAAMVTAANTVDLSSNRLCLEESTDAYQTLVKACGSSSHLTSLDVSDNALSSHSIDMIASALCGDTSQLTSLKLSANLIGTAEGPRSIAAYLRSPSAASLTELHLRRGHLKYAGTECILRALTASSHGIQILDLSENQISHGGDGGGLIAALLKVSTSLTKLDVSENNLRDDDASAIAHAFIDPGEGAEDFPLSSALAELNLSSNKIGGEQVAHTIARMCQNLSCLRLLDCSKNELKFADERVIKDAMQGQGRKYIGTT